MNYTILKECHVKKYSNMTDKNEKNDICIINVWLPKTENDILIHKNDCL